MGVSTDAVLFFGIEFGESCPMFDDDREWYEIGDDMEREAVKKPDVPYTGNNDGPEWTKWRADLKKYRETVGIQTNIHCHNDCPMYYVALTAHHYRNHRGDVTELDLAKMVPTQEQLDALKKFCSDNNIPWSEPGWKLVSYWG